MTREEVIVQLDHLASEIYSAFGPSDLATEASDELHTLVGTLVSLSMDLDETRLPGWEPRG